MRIRSKTLAVILQLSLLLVSLSGFALGQGGSTPITIWSAGGAETRAISRVPAIPRPSIRRVSVGGLRASSALFEIAGGVMFDATAAPCQHLAGKNLWLSYERSRPDGERLVVHDGPNAFAVTGVYDKDLRPIAEFARSPYPVVVNLLGKYPGEKEDCERPKGLLTVTLHPAFLDTQLGWLLTRADMLPYSLMEGNQWYTNKSLPASTNGLRDQLQKTYVEDAKKISQKFVAMGREFLNELPAERRTQILEQVRISGSDLDWNSLEREFVKENNIKASDWDRLDSDNKHALILVTGLFSLIGGGEPTSNINDAVAKPGFCVDNGSVVLIGMPHAEFLSPFGSKALVMESSSDLMSNNIPTLEVVDQEAYDAVLRVYRVGGLFRYVMRQSRASSTQFARFLMSLPPRKNEESPKVVCPSCAPGEVQGWLNSCVSAPNRRGRRNARHRAH
jgi:hypothetical protein